MDVKLTFDVSTFAECLRLALYVFATHRAGCKDTTKIRITEQLSCFFCNVPEKNAITLH